MCCVYSKYTYVLHHTCLYPAKNRLYSDLDCTTAFSCYLLKRRKLVIGETKAFLLDKALAFEGATTQVSWDNVTGKPDSYPPETHTHDMVQVTGLEDELSSMQSAIANKANIEHTHEIVDVINLQTQLNGKAASSHNHNASNITSGTLPVTRGGTGVTTNPSMLINLGSTTAANVFASSPRPGVTGTLPVARGGTGITKIPQIRVDLESTAKAGVFYESVTPGVTGILPVTRGGTGVNSLSALKKNLWIGSSVSSPPSPPSSIPALGGTVAWAGNNWIVVHKIQGIVILASSTVIGEEIPWAVSVTETQYLGCNLFNHCTEYASELKLYACNYVLNFMGNKVFVASYDQLEGGFDYFTSDSRRKCTNGNSPNGQSYWTSTPLNQINTSLTKHRVFYVSNYGNVDHGSESELRNTMAFRPFVCLRT